MVQLIENDANGQTSGTTATQAVGGNTGGLSGTFIDQWSKGTAATVTFDNTFPNDSPNMYKIAVVGTSTSCVGKWLSTTLTSAAATKFGRFLIGFTALPPANTIIANFLDSAAGSVGGMQLTTTGAIRMTNAALTPETTSGITLATNKIYRVDYKMTSHASAGVLESRIYDYRGNPLVWLDRQNITGQVMNGNNIQQLNFGIISPNASNWAIWMLPAVSDTDYIGPRSVAAAAVGSF